MNKKGQFLSDLRVGQEAVIESIPDEAIRAQAIRFGIGNGALVICDEVIPGGPIVLRRHRQQIAIGRGLAQRITIKEVV